jgi:hypothetical protein
MTVWRSECFFLSIHFANKAFDSHRKPFGKHTPLFNTARVVPKTFRSFSQYFELVHEMIILFPGLLDKITTSSLRRHWNDGW